MLKNRVEMKEIEGKIYNQAWIFKFKQCIQWLLFFWAKIF